jgi:predicted DNA binding protein
MSKYKNSVLRYNPRSYLELEGAKVNAGITETILSADANEFAILNNGITIVCDESSISEQSGRLHRAQLFLVNPQIINGGQTAYTLSRIYDRLDPDKREQGFSGKEVLVKAIALTDRGDATTDEERRRTFIERISMATTTRP